MLKSVFEYELLDGMHKSLIKQANNQNLDNVEQAVDYLNSAIDILESQGLNSKANQVFNILCKIAKTKKPHSVPDGHTKNLTSKKMIQNLKQHGTPFNMKDVSFDDDVIDDDDVIVDDLVDDIVGDIMDDDYTFEDE